MKAVRIILKNGNVVMCYVSKPCSKKYGIAFAGTESLNFQDILETNNFEESMKEWIGRNNAFDCIENIESIEVI